jgi:hypothetical protein
VSSDPPINSQKKQSNDLAELEKALAEAHEYRQAHKGRQISSKDEFNKKVSDARAIKRQEIIEQHALKEEAKNKSVDLSNSINEALEKKRIALNIKLSQDVFIFKDQTFATLNLAIEYAEKNIAAKEAKITKIKFIVLFIMVVFIALASLFYYSQTSKVNEPNPNKSYKELRKEILSSGWQVYKRNNRIQAWSKKTYPELDYCDEDFCTASFISLDSSQVREVRYKICSVDRYYQCPNKPNGFEQVTKDILISKSKSDADFLKILDRFKK